MHIKNVLSNCLPFLFKEKETKYNLLRSQENENYFDFDTIPEKDREKIFFEIFKFLSIQDLNRVMRTSKSWNTHANNDKIWEIQIRHFGFKVDAASSQNKQTFRKMQHDAMTKAIKVNFFL